MPPEHGTTGPLRINSVPFRLVLAAAIIVHVLGQDAVTCQPPAVYCGISMQCVPEQDCPADSGFVKCSSLETYCVSQQRCVGVGESCEPPSPVAGSRCPSGLEFCLSRGVCVPPGTCPNHQVSVTDCPRHGEVYCAAQRRCMSAAMCDQGSSGWQNGGMTICGAGTVFCMGSGRCEPATQGCNRPPRAAITCPRGTTYCLATGDCQTTSCPTSSTGVPDSAGKCQDGNMCCATGDSCRRDSDNCGLVCPISHVVCAGESVCVSYRDCVDPSGTGLAWTLPEFVIQASKDPPAAVAMTSLLESPAVKTLLDAHVVPSLTVVATDPGWWMLEDAEDDRRQAVTVGSQLSLVQAVQYRPTRDDGFGVRRISLVQNADKETKLRYSVVQYVVPASSLININMTELTIAEDQPGTLRLSDIVNIVSPASDRELELLGSTLESPDLDRTSEGYRALCSLYQPSVPVRISYTTTFQRRSEVPGELLFSYTDDEDGWKEHALEQKPLLLNLPRNQSSLEQPRVMFMPKPDYQGEVQFTLEVTLGGTTTKTQLTLKVSATNDAPVGGGPAPGPLLLPLGSQSVTVTVLDLVSGVFTDPDGSAIGAAIVSAPSSSLGRWEWAPAGASTWSSLERPENVLIPASSDCDRLPTDGPLAALTQRLAGAGTCGVAANLLAERKTTVVSPQYLAADDQLRFTAEDRTQAWSPAQADKGAVLVLAAWDQTSSPDNVSFPDCSPNCGGSSSLSSSLLHVSVLRSDCTGNEVFSDSYALLRDVCGVCGGTNSTCVVMDCNDDVNGTAYFDCEKCVGGKTGLKPERDCAQQCMVNQKITVEGSEVCVKKEPARTPPCDDVVGLGAYINLCGHCVLGTTGRPALYGRSQCGRCSEDPAATVETSACSRQACDGSTTSPRRLDRCGQCRLPDTADWSACLRFGSPRALVDVGQEELEEAVVEMPVRNQSTPWDNTLESCHVENSEGVITQVNTYSVGTGPLEKQVLVGVSLSDLPLGTYDFNCGEDLAANSFSIVDSSALEIATMEPPEALFQEDNKVEVALAADPVPAAPVLLGLISPAGVKPQLLTASLSRDTADDKPAELGDKAAAKGGSLTALLPGLPSTGVYRAIVAHDRAGLEAKLKKGCDSACQSSARTLRVRSAAPEMTGAEFVSPFRYVAVSFDQPVWSEQGCEDLLDTATLQAMGEPEGEDCTIRGNQLLVRPGPKMAAPSTSMELTLAADSAIVRLGSGGGDLASKASGSVTVNFTQALAESPQLALLGPSIVCTTAGSRATFRALALQDLGRPLTYSWNITLEPETTLSQAKTLAAWQGINEANAREETQTTDTVSSYTIDPAGLLLGDFNYQVFVKGQTWTGATQIESRTFGVSDTGVSVTVSGPDRIAPDSVYTFHATAVSCEQRDDDAQPESLKYSWRMSGVPASGLDGMDGRTLRLDTSELSWQAEYKLTCIVLKPSSGEVFTDTVVLKPAGGGVRARLPAERRAVQPTQPIYIDGGRSADEASRPGSLGYSWSCQMVDSGAGCFVGDASRPPLLRLEQKLGEKAISGPILRVPAGLLAPEQWYRLTLRVEKDGDVDAAHTDVYVNSQPTPMLWIDKQQDVFDPFREIFVQAQVSTDWPVTVVWQTDFPLSEEILKSASFRPTPIRSGARRRQFDLVLPALEKPGSEDGCALCGKVLRFALSADMETSDSLVFSAKVELKMMDAPLLGELKVSDAKGLMTSLDASEGWTTLSNTLQLSYEFGFVSGDGVRVAMATVVNDMPKAEILLPRDAVSVYVRVCPTGGVCLTVDSDVKPKEGTVSDEQGIRELGDRLVDVTELGRPEQVVAWSMAVMDRLPQPPNDAAKNLQTIVQYVTRRALVDIGDRLRAAADSDNAKQKTRATDQAILALELLRRPAASSPALEELAKALSAQRGTLQELVSAILLPSTGYTTETFAEPPTQTVPSKVPVRLPAPNMRRVRRSLRRRKRAAPAAPSAHTLDAVKALRLLMSAEASSEPGELLSTADSLLASLCAGLPSTNSQPVAVLGDKLELQAARRELDVALSSTWWPLVEGGGISDGTLLRGSPDWRSWKWECGTDPEREVPILCRDMCVASWTSRDDLLSASADRLQGDLPPRRTAIYNVKLLHPKTLEPQFVDQKLEAPFIVRITVNASMELPKNRMLECRSWQRESWSAAGCDTRPVSSGRLPCRCTRLGAVAAFEVDAPDPTTTPLPSTTTEELNSTEMMTSTFGPSTGFTDASTTVQNNTLKIDADFDAIVGDRVDEFAEHMEVQLASSLNLSKSAITVTRVYRGSIMVDFSVESTTLSHRTKSSAQDPLKVLTQLVQSGQLELTDLEGNRLVIPRDGLDGVKVDPVKEEKNTRTAVIIGAVIAVIVVLCIIGVIVAVVIKNKKRSKVGATTSPTDRNQQNTYKSFQFEHVMDGTAASLEKYKSSRGMDDSDRYLAETMRAHSAAAMRRTSIPRPARYDTPSREQLEATQAIPETLQENPAP